jgi:hypothetical protein
VCENVWLRKKRARWFNPTSSRAVNNFRLPFRGWFSTVPVDWYFLATLSNVDQGMSNKSFFLCNFTINSLGLQPISYVYNLRKLFTARDEVGLNHLVEKIICGL